MEPDTIEQHILDEVTSWPGISTAPGRFGETDFLLGGRTIGHVHGASQADIPFPRKIRDELVAAGRTGPHHIHPESTWTTRYIDTPADADDVIALLRINYDRLANRRRSPT